jgi:hypothetical protein
MRLTRAQRRSFTRRLDHPGGPARFAVRPWIKLLLALATAAAAVGLAWRALVGLR